MLLLLLLPLLPMLLLLLLPPRLLSDIFTPHPPIFPTQLHNPPIKMLIFLCDPRIDISHDWRDHIYPHITHLIVVEQQACMHVCMIACTCAIQLRRVWCKGYKRSPVKKVSSAGPRKMKINVCHMPKYGYIYKTIYTVSIVMCMMVFNMRMCIAAVCLLPRVAIFFVFPFPFPRES